MGRQYRWGLIPPTNKSKKSHQETENHTISCIHEMLGSDWAIHILFMGQNEVDGLFCGNMLHRDTKIREIVDQRLQNSLDKGMLTVEDVQFRIRDLSVNAEVQFQIGHFLLSMKRLWREIRTLGTVSWYLWHQSWSLLWHQRDRACKHKWSCSRQPFRSLQEWCRLSSIYINVKWMKWQISLGNIQSHQELQIRVSWKGVSDSLLVLNSLYNRKVGSNAFCNRNKLKIPFQW